MSVKTADIRLAADFAAEMRERIEAGECVRLELNIHWAMTLLAALQLALREPSMDGPYSAILHVIARSIEDRIGTTPAAKEICRRGWFEEYDQRIDPDLPVTNGQPN
jgi:hypothetical protein